MKKSIVSNKKILILLLPLLIWAIFDGPLFFDNDIDFKTKIYLFFQVRLPSLLMALITGAGLSLVGYSYQSLFQNSLASPYTLGISSFAALGYTLYLFIDKFWIDLPLIYSGIMCFGFCLVGLFIILRLVKRSPGISYILLFGVSVSLLVSSLLVFAHLLLGNRDGFGLMVSLMGHIEEIGFLSVIIQFVALIVFTRVCFKWSTPLRLASVNHEFAKYQGVDYKKMSTEIIITSSLFLALSVVNCGPLAFVGLIVPHIVRLFFKKTYDREIFFNMLTGGLFLTSTLYLSRLEIAGNMLPIGVLTSIIGGPIFIYLVFREIRSNRLL